MQEDSQTDQIARIAAERNGEIIDVATGQSATIDGPCVERGVTIGYNAEARDQAVKDLTGFLESIFDG